MKDYKLFFKNKKITLMGLGLLGRGVGDAKFLAECGADLLVTDLKSKTELKESLHALREYKNIKYVLGKHRLADFRARDMIIKAAGVLLGSPYIEEARTNKIPVFMSTALFVKLLPLGTTVIGVTGTRGKSTVTHLLYNIVQRQKELSICSTPGVEQIESVEQIEGVEQIGGKGEGAQKQKRGKGKHVFLGGNVRKISTLAFLGKVKEGDVVVLELDSWQLQGFGDAKMSPSIAVFTNFLDDHLNYYKNDRSRYLDDKANIFKFQKKGDTLIVGSQCAEFIRKQYPSIKSKIVVVQKSDIPKSWKIALAGEHNRDNVACAVFAARVLGISDASIQEGLREFTGLPGRMELVRELNGVKIYNDTTATTPDATIAALKTLAPRLPSTKLRTSRSGQNQNKKAVLILGGADKGLGMERLMKEIPLYCKAVILLPGTGTSKLQSANCKVQNFKTANLREAVKKGIAIAEKGDILLFSPAFASFGLFKNEFDRGQQFNDVIKDLS